MAALTLGRVTGLTNQNPVEIKKLEIRNTSIEYLDDLSECTELEKVDLSKNAIEEAHGLRECTKVRWLNVANNSISDLDFVNNMLQLSVLNAGHNQIRHMKCVCRLTELKALILNNNCISKPLGLHKLAALNTLVLSHNAISEIDVSGLTSLTKLQLSHNRIHTFPDITANCELKTLSLNDNEIMKVPANCIGENRLELVDLGRNKITKLKHVSSLSHIRTLRQLNVKGNPVDQLDSYTRKMLLLFPRLQILDSKPVDKLMNSEPQQDGSDGSTHSSTAGKKRSHDIDSGSEIIHKKRKKQKLASEDESVDQAVSSDESQVKAASIKVKVKKKMNAAKIGERKADGSTTEYSSSGDMNDDMSTVEHSKKKKNKIDLDQSERTFDELTGKSKKLKKSKTRSKGGLIHEGGVSALKDSNSGVVAIKDKKKKKKGSSQLTSSLDTEDLFSSFQTDIGSGSGSGW